MAKVNWSAIKVQDTEPVQAKSRGRSSMADGTPFPQLLAETLETGKAKSFVIPADAVEYTIAVIRSAARPLNVNARTSVEEDGNGKARVTFQAVERRTYRTRNS